MALVVTISIAATSFLFFLWAPRRGLMLLLFLLPFSIALNPLPGVDLVLLRLLVPMFWLAILIKYPALFLGELKKLPSIALGLFLSVLTLSTLFAEEPSWSARKLVYLWSLAPLLPAVSLLLRQRHANHFYKPLLFGGALAAVIGVAQFVLQFFVGTEQLFRFFVALAPRVYGREFGDLVVEFPSWFVRVGDREYLRALAFFPDPHMFAFYLTLISSLALSLLFMAKTERGFMLFFACYVLYVACLLLTFSRGGYLGLLASTAVVLWFVWARQTKTRRRAAAVSAMGVGVAALALLFQPPVAGRFMSSFDITEGSNAGRIHVWLDALEKSAAHSLGIGLGNYALAADEAVELRNPITAHNLYLDILVEGGAFSLVAYGMFILTGLYGLWRLARQSGSGRLKSTSVGFLAALVGFSAHAFFENPLWAPPMFLLLLIIAAFSANGLSCHGKLT